MNSFGAAFFLMRRLPYKQFLPADDILPYSIWTNQIAHRKSADVHQCTRLISGCSEFKSNARAKPQDTRNCPLTSLYHIPFSTQPHVARSWNKPFGQKTATKL
jgi:hypothetical protein